MRVRTDDTQAPAGRLATGERGRTVSSAPARILFIRHGDPEPGDDDPGLSREGRLQAARLSVWLAEEPFAAVVSSPLRRAHETATLVFPDRRVQVCDDLEEWDLAVAAMSVAPTSSVGRDSIEASFGQALAGFKSRVHCAVTTIAAEHPGGNVAVVCHGGVINTVIARIIGLDRPAFFVPGHTSMHRLAIYPTGEGVLESLNETPHLALCNRRTGAE